MDIFAALVLSAVVSEESLRFAAVFEQEAETSCALATAVSLLSLYCRKEVDENSLGLALLASRPPGEGFAREGRLVSLEDIRGLIESSGVAARVFRMSEKELYDAAGMGFVPVFLHYDRPRGHFALLLGAKRLVEGELVFVTADPVRGIEALVSGAFLERWSGAALFVDPASFSPEGKSLRDASVSLALRRRALLERLGDRDAPWTVAK